MPGNSTADVSLKRLMTCEAAKVDGIHHITVFMDLSAFYEHISHDALIADALEIQFPAHLLHLAMSIYMGRRMIRVSNLVTPSFTADRGVLAGDLLAPVLAKVALRKPLKRLLSKPQVHSADVWVDDISVDVQRANAEKAARNALHTYRQLKGELLVSGHKPSDQKTFFLASSTQSTKALNAMRAEGDPSVKNVGLDLGMATSGAKARTCVGQRTG